MVSAILAAILGAIALVFVLLPIVRPPAPPVDRPESELDALLREKENVYLAIREVEFDHRTGKVSDEDHLALMARYRTRAVELLERIDAARAAAPQPASASPGGDGRDLQGAVEAEIAATLSSDPRTAAPLPVCASCGRRNLPIHRFCTGCGRPMPEGSAIASGDSA